MEFSSHSMFFSSLEGQHQASRHGGALFIKCDQYHHQQGPVESSDHGISDTMSSLSSGCLSMQGAGAVEGGTPPNCHEMMPERTKRARRRQRTAFSIEQLQKLEHAFKCSPYPGINEREDLSAELKIAESRIQVWFQNRRARYRKQAQLRSRRHVSSSFQGNSTEGFNFNDRTPYNAWTNNHA